MEDFLMREITKASKEYDGIVARRTRTSAGFAQISIEFAGKKLIFTNEDGNDEYEFQAREVAKILDAVADNSCNLPESA